MKILVTGGAGFIGSHVVETLLGRGDEVVVLDNFNDFYDPAIKRENVEGMMRLADGRLRVVEGDIRDADCVRSIFSAGEFDAVVHLAAMAGVRRSISDSLLYSDVNERYGTDIAPEEHHEGM